MSNSEQKLKQKNPTREARDNPRAPHNQPFNIFKKRKQEEEIA